MISLLHVDEGRHTSMKPILAAIMMVSSLLLLVGCSEADRKVVDLGDDVEMAFIWINPGTFMMGSPPNEDRRMDGEGQRKVTISRGFWLAETPTTQAQWEQIMGNNPSADDNGDRDRPVTSISWNDSVQFAERLTERMRQRGVIGSNDRFRLPTEAEWEYACRAGTTTAFSFGDDTGQLGDFAWYDGNIDSDLGDILSNTHSESPIQPVARKKPNPWGLYDMHGNVYEWVKDWFDNYPNQAETDPTGPRTGSYRVRRGGSWYLPSGDVRSASRDGLDPDNRSGSNSVRLALDLN